MASEDKDPPAPSSTSLSFSFTSKKERRSVPVNVANAAPKSQAITALKGSTFLGDVDADEDAPTRRVIAPLANTYRGPAGASKSTNGKRNEDGQINEDGEKDGDRGELENGAGQTTSGDGGKREHEYGAGKKFVPSFVPPTQDVRQILEGEDRFENVELPVADSGPVMYGLLRRSAPQDDGEAGTGNGGNNENGASGSGGGGGDKSRDRSNWGDKNSNSRAPMLDPRKLRQEMDARKLKQDLDDLPPEADLDDYERMPVEEIGMALLRGYGWKEGQGVGRNKQKVDAIEYVKRPERLGIGAQPAVTLKDTRPLKMGEKRKDKDMVVAPDASGRPRNIKSLDEKLVPRAQVAPGVRDGKVMRVVGGRHEGLKARVVKLLPKEEGRSDRALVCLLPSEETVEVRCKDLGELDSQVNGHAQHSRDHDRGERGDKSAKGRPRQEEDTDNDGRGEHGGDYPSKRHHASDPSRDGDRKASRGREDDRGDKLGDRGHDKSKDRGKDGQRDSEREKGRGSQQGGASPSYQDRRGAAGHRTQESSRAQENSRVQQKSHMQESSEEESSSSEDEGHGGGKGSSPGHPNVPGHKLWLASHIRVKVVGEVFKQAKGGRLYLKKGAVVDVQPGGYCLVKVDASGETVRLHQSDLETVVPKKPDSYVLVVAGEYKRQRAKLLSCNQELAAIQLLGELNIVRLPLDDIAEYVGPADED